MAYKEEDFLQLSGIQHFSFCKRQWALIHIEQQWEENYRTADGAIFHQNAHNGAIKESRGNILIARGMNIHSATLGIAGICDVVEFHRCSDGIPLHNHEGLWKPFPIEYKRGKVGYHTQADAMQLCAQAMCLEEMLCCNPILEGALFYGETRHRIKIPIDKDLKNLVVKICDEMHTTYQRGITPKVKKQQGCKNCSLIEHCLPSLFQKSALKYLQSHMEDDE